LPAGRGFPADSAFRGGFRRSIARAGEFLAVDFPKQADDVNELDDHLVEL